MTNIKTFIILRKGEKFCMKKYLVNNGSKMLLIFFTGWGCDESEFSHLKADTDVFAKNYLIKNEEERKKFDHSKRRTANV